MTELKINGHPGDRGSRPVQQLVFVVDSESVHGPVEALADGGSLGLVREALRGQAKFQQALRAHDRLPTVASYRVPLFAFAVNVGGHDHVYEPIYLAHLLHDDGVIQSSVKQIVRQTAAAGVPNA
jgi:hypothetical protein